MVYFKTYIANNKNAYLKTMGIFRLKINSVKNDISKHKTTIIFFLDNFTY